jgi:hypothetical protein
MKKSIIFLAFFFIIILFGCQKNDTNDQITGKWKWVKEFKNDTLINTSNYKIETSNTGQLRLISSIITSNFSIDKDSLIFNEAYVDGPVIWYVKIKK